MAAQETPIRGYLPRLKGREQVAEGTVAFHFEKPAGFEFRAGQAMDVTLLDPPESDSEGNTRTFSIASAPFESELMTATRMRDTAFKRSLSKVPLGTPVKVDSATGSLTLHKNSAKPAVFLAGGIGITPFHSIVRQADRERLPHQLYLFYSNRRPEDAAFLDTTAPVRKDESQLPADRNHDRDVAVAKRLERRNGTHQPRDAVAPPRQAPRLHLLHRRPSGDGGSYAQECWSRPPWTKMTSGWKSSPDTDQAPEPGRQPCLEPRAALQ
jgi:ferredoxin-NADP reductase